MSSWIGKQRYILDFTLASMTRRKGRNLALLVVYAAVVFMLASVMFFACALKKEAALLLQGSPDIVVQRMVAGRQELIPTEYLTRLRSIRGVSSGTSRLWGYYYYPSAKANFTVMAPEGFANRDGTVLIGNGVARTLRIGRGEEMWFQASDGKAVKFTVSGSLPAESEIISSDLILMSASDFQRLFLTPEGHATDLVLSVRNPRELATIAEKITQLLPDARPIIRDEILRTYEAIFDWRQGIMIAILTGGLFAFVILAWDRASGLSAEERREIGILKAIGWETSDVILVKFWEGTVISLTSFLVGIVLAYVHIFFSASVLFAPVLKGWAVLYPQLRPEPFIDPYQVTTLFFLTVIPYTVATIVPSWRAATIDPDAQMR
jgi:ABC-type lipoprotein release transport system permease subunit